MGELSGKRGEHSLDTARSGFVAAVVEKFWSRPDASGTRISRGHEPAS
jgi:hypothetical protein